MKTFASEVAPTATPSMGTGKASARSAAAKSAATPASVDPAGRSAPKDHAAAAAIASPPPATGATTVRSRVVPGESRGVSLRAGGASETAAARLADRRYQVQPSPSPAIAAMTPASARSFTSVPFHESIELSLLSCVRVPLPGFLIHRPT
jgi:long-chain acyl-CoA synthetase